MLFSIEIEGLKVWAMTWACQISLFTCYFLAIGCRGPAWNLTVKCKKATIGLILCCAAFIVIGLCWLLLFSVKSAPKTDFVLDNKRMSLVNGTGVDPAGQMFKQCVQQEGSLECVSEMDGEESDQKSTEVTTSPPRRRKRTSFRVKSEVNGHG